MFHRTLTPDDARWPTCDPDYTLPRDVLARCLRFFKRHYNVVTLQQVLEARRQGRALPPRALLLTFDDGWADNADHALPELQREGLPGVMFVVADAVGRATPFWQECLVATWRSGEISVAALQDKVHAESRGTSGGSDVAEESLDALRAQISAIERMTPDQRRRVLATLPQMTDNVRHMVDVDDLRRLRHGGVELGLHGKTHVRMTQAADLDAELAGARSALAATLGADAPGLESMSFPHGRYDANVARHALEAGYELLFTSVPVLNSTAGGIGWLLGRTGFETDTVMDKRGRFRPERLALHLFRSELRHLS